MVLTWTRDVLGDWRVKNIPDKGRKEKKQQLHYHGKGGDETLDQVTVKGMPQSKILSKKIGVNGRAISFKPSRR